MLLKYKTIHILLTNVHLDCRGEGSSNRNASRDESVEARDESVETRDESIEAGEKHNNHVIIIYHLVWVSRGLASWGPRIQWRWGSLGMPQGDAHKSLIRQKQQIFSYKIEEVVSLKCHHINIGPDIDLMCPTSGFFPNIVIE